MKGERRKWNEKYTGEDFEMPEEAVPVLRRRVEELPDGRALDVATGTGRNALFLAENGYEVDAVDISDEGLSRAREKARERGVDVNWIQCDLDTFVFPEEAYDVVAMSFYYNMNRFPDVKECLAPGGVLVYEHHLRSREAETGPSDDRYRFRPNDLLRACLDLTVMYYSEEVRRDGRTSAVATVVARNSGPGDASYPGG